WGHAGIISAWDRLRRRSVRVVRVRFVSASATDPNFDLAAAFGEGHVENRIGQPQPGDAGFVAPGGAGRGQPFDQTDDQRIVTPETAQKRSIRKKGFDSLVTVHHGRTRYDRSVADLWLRRCREYKAVVGAIEEARLPRRPLENLPRLVDLLGGYAQLLHFGLKVAPLRQFAALMLAIDGSIEGNPQECFGLSGTALLLRQYLPAGFGEAHFAAPALFHQVEDSGGR